MKARDVLKLIPEGLLERLALETKVDHQVKKLSGEVVFKLILFSMLNADKLSLRVMESFLASAKFAAFCESGAPPANAKYNSLSERLCTIKADYFQKLFEKIFQVYNQELREQTALSKTDSTYVALAATLLPEAMVMGRDKSKRYVKYVVRLKGSLPAAAEAFSDQDHVNEEKALAALIKDCDSLQDEVVVFDRGLQSRASFDHFTGQRIFFITRARAHARCLQPQSRPVPSKPTGSTVTISSDQTGHLMTKREKKSLHPYRLIRATIDAGGEELCFITNLYEEDAYTVARWYKERWEIELFFKFLKQHLNLTHLVSRTENGIQVMLYMTLILATLLIVYKKKNNLKSFKLAKLKFELELEEDIIQTIVSLCGGDPGKAAHLWNTS